jgi:hypothetical protein
MKKLTLFIICCLICLVANAQNFVSTTPSNKNVLLESFGGINCFYCPEADYSALQLLNQNNNRFVWINTHAGIFAEPSALEPDFRTSAGDSALQLSQITVFPAGMVNRKYFQSLSQNNGLSIEASNWSAATDSILSESSPVNVAAIAELNVFTRELKIIVETYYTANANNVQNQLFVALLQDSIVAPQAGNVSMNPLGFESTGKYTHRFILQDYITVSSGLDILNTSAGTFRADTFYYNLPADFNGTEFSFFNPKIAVWIADSDSTEILNAAYASINLTSNENLAAEIKNVNWDSDFNTICGNESSAKIRIENLGNNPIDSIRIDYDINLGQSLGSYTHYFPNALSIGQEVIVQMPTINNLTEAANTVNFNIELINGLNNPIFQAFSAPINHASLFVSDSTNGTFFIRYDNYPDDVSWSLKDETAGSVILTDSISAGGNTSLSQFFTAIDGHCYSLKVSDAAGDGICCTSGQGFFKLTIGNLQIIRDSDFEFESGLKFTFQKGVIAVNTIDPNSFDFEIFPNPASQHVTIKTESKESAEANISIINSLGQELKTFSQFINQGVNYQNLSLDGIGNGFYFVRITIGNEQMVKKLLIER